jgi:hypothetical protein
MSKDNGFSTIVVELITGLPLEFSMMIKYIIDLVTSLGKPILVTCSHIIRKPYYPYTFLYDRKKDIKEIFSCCKSM